MPISEFYESTIDKVTVHFGFDGFEDSPDEITRILEIQPDETRTKGQQLINKAGKSVLVRENSWAISSTAQSKDVNVHMRELIKKLEGKEFLIKENWNSGFSVVWKGNNLFAGSGPFYERDVLNGVVKLKAELWHDIYQSVSE